MPKTLQHNIFHFLQETRPVLAVAQLNQPNRCLISRMASVSRAIAVLLRHTEHSYWPQNLVSLSGCSNNMPDHHAAFKYRTIHNILVIDEYKIKNPVLVTIPVQHYDKHLRTVHTF